MQNQPPADSREKKRAQFSEAPRPKNRTTPMLVGVAVVMIAVAAYFVINSRSSDKPSATTVAGDNPAAAAASDIRIPLADLSAKAKFFDYKLADNQPMRFFVLKSSDGVYRAALDACDTCYHAKKGYRQEGDDMVCNNCGLHFHSAQVNEVHGGCNPVGLPRSVDGDQLVIKVSDLESRKQYF